MLAMMEATCEDVPTKNGHVLVVEDEELLSTVLEQYLADAGLGVLVASRGQQALAMIEAEAASTAILLTDVDMPGLSGWELARKARAVSPLLPVVYMTGGRADEWSTEGVPGSVLLNKPFNQAAALALIRRLLS